MKKYEFHPLANLFPMIEEPELASLSDDIMANGLSTPIVLFEGKILDGRNRYEACEMAQVEPEFKEYKGKNPRAFVLSKNLHRRHLTVSQRAMIAAKISNLPEGSQGSTGSNDPVELSQSEAAKSVGVSRKSVTRAKKALKESSKKDIAAIQAGEKTVSQVLKETEEKNEEPAVKKQLFDEEGFPIPDCILEDWARAVSKKDSIKKISDLRCELKHALEEKDVIFAELNQGAVAHLDNAYTAFKRLLPYAVCTSCQGHKRSKCTDCRHRGFISKFTWDTCVPIEIRELRKKMVVAK